MAEFIQVSNGEIASAIEHATNRNDRRQYQERSDSWGKGLVDAKEVRGVGRVPGHIMAIAAGLIGEMAVSRYLCNEAGNDVIAACEVDTTITEYGDGGIDLCPAGIGIDVKTRLHQYPEFLIRSHKDSGVLMSWTCDVFMFCDWKGGPFVAINGWICARDASAVKSVPARKGKHMNVAIKKSELRKPGELASIIADRIRERSIACR